MNIYFRNKKGFTLIELLVVVAIISLLSSVMLASLNASRLKAKDAAIKSELRQLSTLATLNYSDYGSYSNIQPSGAVIDDIAQCSLYFSGAYAQKAIDICRNIVSLATGAGAGPGDPLFIATNGVSETESFSFIAFIPSVTQYACIGSSGAITFPVVDIFFDPGCYLNP